MLNLKKSIVVAAIAVASLAIAQTARLELQARLSGVGQSKVSWKVDDRGTQRQAELQAEGENLPRNTSFAVVIGNNGPLMLTTNGFGVFRTALRFNSLNRPTIAAGDAVALVDANGNVVQSGVMQPR